MPTELLAHVPSDKQLEAQKAQLWLYKHQPVWLLKLDGTLIAANLLALWLWDLLSPGLLQAQELPPLRAFDIFAANLKRLPLSENSDFLQRKSSTAKFVEERTEFGEEPILAFKQAMMKRPELKEIYVKADAEDFPKTFNYELNIKPPRQLKPPALLQFKTHVYMLLGQDGKAIGFGTVYNPLGITQSIVETKCKQLIDRYGNMSYILYNEGGGDFAVKERFTETQRAHDKAPHSSALSENEVSLLSQPDITLYANRSEQSQQVFEMLEETHLGFRVVASPRRKVPSTEWGGIRFRGLEGAQHLVRMLEAFESTFITEAKKTMPNRFKNVESKRDRPMDEKTSRQIDEARTVMSKLYTPTSRTSKTPKRG